MNNIENVMFDNEIYKMNRMNFCEELNDLLTEYKTKLNAEDIVEIMNDKMTDLFS